MRWLLLQVLLLSLLTCCSFNLEKAIRKEKERRNEQGVVEPNKKELEKMYKQKNQKIRNYQNTKNKIG